MVNLGKIDLILMLYVDVVKKFGVEKNVLVIDLYVLSFVFCEELGLVKIVVFNFVKDKKLDMMYLDVEGVVVFVELIVGELWWEMFEFVLLFCMELFVVIVWMGVVVIKSGKLVVVDVVVFVDNLGMYLMVSVVVVVVLVNGIKLFVILIKFGVYKEYVYVLVDKLFIVLWGELGEMVMMVIICDVNLKLVKLDGKKYEMCESVIVLV